jgi:cold shock CspA family protein
VIVQLKAAGFGFIKPEHGRDEDPDLYFHASACKKISFDRLRLRDKVVYEVGIDERRDQSTAKNVWLAEMPSDPGRRRSDSRRDSPPRDRRRRNVRKAGDELSLEESHAPTKAKGSDVEDKGWVKAHKAFQMLRQLGGTWQDQRDSQYTLTPGRDDALDVCTQRPAPGKILRTRNLIHIEYKGDLGRVVWGHSSPSSLYTIASFDDKVVVWQREGSATFMWARVSPASNEASTVSTASNTPSTSVSRGGLVKGRWAADDSDEDLPPGIVESRERLPAIFAALVPLEEGEPWQAEAQAESQNATQPSAAPRTMSPMMEEGDEPTEAEDMEDGPPLARTAEKVGRPPVVVEGDRRREQQGAVEEALAVLNEQDALQEAGHAQEERRVRVCITSTNGQVVDLVTVCDFCAKFGEVVAMRLGGSGVETFVVVEFRDADAAQECVRQRESESLHVAYFLTIFQEVEWRIPEFPLIRVE